MISNSSTSATGAAAATKSIDQAEDSSQTGVDELWKVEEKVHCPGRAAAQRLRRFDESWDPQNSISDFQQLGDDDLHVDRILGHGSWSTAYQAFVRNPLTGNFDSERSYALKRLKPEVTKDRESDPQLFETASSDLALETKILANLQHENIISLRGVKKGDMIESLAEGTFFIVLDLLVETLDTRLERWAVQHKKKKKKSIFSPRAEIALTRRFQDVAMGIAKAMEYLHKRNIMFR
jgi:serine/threonine protein kinase